MDFIIKEKNNLKITFSGRYKRNLPDDVNCTYMYSNNEPYPLKSKVITLELKKSEEIKEILINPPLNYEI